MQLGVLAKVSPRVYRKTDVKHDVEEKTVASFLSVPASVGKSACLNWPSITTYHILSLVYVLALHTELSI